MSWIVGRSLQVYYLDVRPNFKPKIGVPQMQTRFQGSENLVWTEPFLFNSTGNSTINFRDKSKKEMIKVSLRVHGI